MRKLEVKHSFLFLKEINFLPSNWIPFFITNQLYSWIDVLPNAHPVTTLGIYTLLPGPEICTWCLGVCRKWILGVKRGDACVIPGWVCTVLKVSNKVLPCSFDLGVSIFRWVELILVLFSAALFNLFPWCRKLLYILMMKNSLHHLPTTSPHWWWHPLLKRSLRLPNEQRCKPKNQPRPIPVWLILNGYLWYVCLVCHFFFDWLLVFNQDLTVIIT